MIGIEGEDGFQRADGTPVPDAALSTTSTNSVQNKVISGVLPISRRVSQTTNSSGMITISATANKTIIGVVCTNAWVQRACAYNENEMQVLITDSSGTAKANFDAALIVTEIYSIV